MKKIMMCMLSVSLLVGCASGVESEAVSSVEEEVVATPEVVDIVDDKVKEVVEGMDLKTKVEQMIMPSIRSWNGEDFTVMNDEIRTMLSEHHYGGIIYFAQNFSDNHQVIELTQSMQVACVESGGVPLLIGTDQEGGYITRLTNGTSTIGNMALSATGDSSNAKKSAEIISQELEALGLNLDFAPSMDVNSNPANPIIGVRSFSDDAETVASFSGAYLSGLNENDIIGCVKHFPGHGDTDTDSHTGLPLVNRSKEEVLAQDLVPYQELIDELDMIMSAHIQFPQIETGTYTSILDGSTINLPATLSKTWITDILRGELGYEGVVITDSLQMDAIDENFSSHDSASLAINAGVDMLLMPVEITDTDSIQQLDAYVDEIVEMVNDGEIDEALITNACMRIIRLKYKKGIMDRTYSEEMKQAMLAQVDGIVGSEASREAEREMGDEAVTVLKNDNDLLPYHASDASNIVMIAKSYTQANMLYHGFYTLQNEGYIPANAEITVVNENYGYGYDACMNAIYGADLVVVTSNMDAGDQIDTANSIRIAYVQDYIAVAKEQGISVIAISSGVPYDTPLLQQADAILCVYNPAGALQVDESYNPIGTYSVNLFCAEDVIFNKVSPSGTLPVDVPAIEEGQFTSDIMYPRGMGHSW